MNSISPDARCESAAIGADTSIGAFAVIPASCVIGATCNVGVSVTLAEGVALADRVTLEAGVRIGPGVRVEEGTRIGANTTIGEAGHEGAPPSIAANVTIGAGAFVASGTRLGMNCVVRPGSVVTSDIPPNAVVEGNPARIVAYSESPVRELDLVHAATAVQASTKQPMPLPVGAAALWSLPHVGDIRGSLVPIEFSENLPFMPVRQFLVFGVPGERVRGEHAHKLCDQFLVAAHGALSVVLDDGSTACEVRLDYPNVGLYVPAGIWTVQYKFSQDAVLAVFASRRYEPDDYLRDYRRYLEYRSLR